MKVFKIALIIIINFVILIGAGFFALSVFVKTDKIKTIISSQVSSLTGQPFVINGKVHFSLYPVVGMSFQDAILENPVGFDQSVPMMTVADGKVGISLLSLLKGRVVVKKIMLDQPVIRIIQNNAAGWNMQALGQKTEPASQKSGTQIKANVPEQTTEMVSPSNILKELPDVLFKNGQIIIQSNDGKKTNISAIQFSLKNEDFHTELPFKISFAINQQQLQGTVVIKGQFVVKSDHRANLQLLEIDTYFLSGKNKVNMHGSMDIVIDPNEMQIELYGAVTNGMSMTGNATIKNYQAGVRGLIANGELAIDAINTQKFKISKISAKIHGKNGIIQLSPLSANLYGSPLTGSAGINLTQKTPIFFLKSSLNNINVQSLLKNMLGINKLVGVGNLSVNLSANSLDSEKMLRTLNGNLTFNIHNGQFLGFDLLNFMRTALLIIYQKPPALFPKKESTNFGSAQGTATIRNGVLYNNDLLLITPDASVKGYGSMNFVLQKIDYELDATPKNAHNAIIPIMISGHLTHPDVALNMGKVLQQTAKRVLLGPAETIQKGITKPVDLLKKILQ